MLQEEAIKILEKNRDANPYKPSFVEACNMAIHAISDHRVLTNRCRALTEGGLCMFCRVNYCQHRP